MLVLSDAAREPFLHEGLRVSTQHHHPDWRRVLAGFEAVLVLYCSDAAYEITGVVGSEVVVVLDVYVPWYVETAARGTVDLRREYGHFLNDVARWNEVLVRGDVFLCANPAQHDFYLGVLSALGSVNPLTYEHLRVIEVPFGVDARPVAADDLPNPYTSLGVPGDAFVLLWFGAMYPWFDIDPVLEAVQALAAELGDLHFVVVGGRNPLVPDADYGRGYARARAALAPLDGSQVHFVDWVAYDTRREWYSHADVAVTFNVQGLENRYSWRTRLADFVAAELPVITNGGDPLGEDVLAAGGAFRSADRAEDLVEVVRRLHERPAPLADARAALADLHPRFSWRASTSELADLLDVIEPSHAREEAFVRLHHLSRRSSRPRGVERALLGAAHVLRRVREEGVSGTAAVLQDMAAPRLIDLRRRWHEGRPDRRLPGGAS